MTLANETPTTQKPSRTAKEQADIALKAAADNMEEGAVQLARELLGHQGVDVLGSIELDNQRVTPLLLVEWRARWSWHSCYLRLVSM